MMKLILAAGVAAVGLTAAPAAAKPHHNRVQCTKWRHGTCIQTRRVIHRQAYRVGYRFGPRYGYTSYSALPRTYVTRYRLSPRYRYVYRDNYIYQVDPTTYAITRILNAL